MRNTRASNPNVDKLLLILRGLPLLGMFAFVALADDPQTDDLALLVLTGIGAAYGIIAAFVFFSLPRESNAAITFVFALATLGIDLLLAAVLYLVSNDNALIMVAMGLFPVLVAWLRFGWPVGVFATSALGLACALIAFKQEYDLGAAVAGVVFLLAAGIVATGLHRFMFDPRSSLDELEQEALRLREARERTKALYDMSLTLSSTLKINSVLEAALGMGAHGLREVGAQMVGCAMLVEEHDNRLHVRAARRLTRSDSQVVIEGRRGAVGMTVQQGEPMFVSEPHRDPELRYFAALQDCKSVLCIPLRAGLNNYGVLIFGAPQPQAFDDAQTDLLASLGIQAAIALQNATLYNDLLEEKERIVDVEEDARKKLARDLHDGPTQTVSGIAMRVGVIRNYLERSPDQVSVELVKVEEMAHRAVKEIRHFLFTLRPLVLETQGLSAALRQFAEKMQDTHGLNVIVETDPITDDVLDDHAQGVVFYIVDEAVGNARKHAQADHVWVRLYLQRPYFIIEVEDDGEGFDLEATRAGYETRESQSLGLINMEERASLVEGGLRIESAPGKGTKVSVLIPLASKHINQPAIR